MRKILLLLATAAVCAGAVQSASADTTATYRTVQISPTRKLNECTTVWQYGVYGQYGAWGDYIDGCTAGLPCYAAHYCIVYNQSYIETRERTNHRVTQNARLRYGIYHADDSCSGINSCSALPRLFDVTTIYPGQYASIQCNGVRDEMIPDRDQTLARNVCQMQLDAR
jgi:hypothetical protein